MPITTVGCFVRSTWTRWGDRTRVLATLSCALSLQATHLPVQSLVAGVTCTIPKKTGHRGRELRPQHGSAAPDVASLKVVDVLPEPLENLSLAWSQELAVRVRHSEEPAVVGQYPPNDLAAPDLGHLTLGVQVVIPDRSVHVEDGLVLFQDWLNGSTSKGSLGTLDNAEGGSDLVPVVCLPPAKQVVWVILRRLVDDSVARGAQKDDVLIGTTVDGANERIGARARVTRGYDVRHFGHVHGAAAGDLDKKIAGARWVLTEPSRVREETTYCEAVECNCTT